MQNTLSQYIEVTEGVCSGRPRIAGHRITVQNVAFWHEKMGLTADQIADEYGLRLSEVYAALAYYYDNRAEIDSQGTLDAGLIEELRQKTPSKLRAKLRDRLGA